VRKPGRKMGGEHRTNSCMNGATPTRQGSEGLSIRIRVTRRPDCIVCRSPGQVLYEGLTDRTSGASGVWTLRRCASGACGLIWLDPMPAEDEIWKAYTTYYTHSQIKQSVPQVDPVRRLFRTVMSALESGYHCVRYGHHGATKSPVKLITGLLGYLFPWRQSEWDLSAAFLQCAPGGRLLEVGCGSGDLLKKLGKLGWCVEGLDTDAHAVEIAVAKGLLVRCGTLKEMKYPGNQFDAIVMVHVIEHVHDPFSLLRECSRVLKSDGWLVLVTPNVRSLCHKLFGRSWLHLDPPRHLHLFTQAPMKRLLDESGFQKRKLFTTVRDADGVFAASRAIRRTGKYKMQSRQPRIIRMLGRCMQMAEWLALWVQPSCGEELTVVAQKNQVGSQ